MVCDCVYLGMWQGGDPDSSDKEWESSIQRDFGERGAGMLREAAARVDEGLDTNGIVNHAFHMYDNFAESNWGNLLGSDSLEESGVRKSAFDEGSNDDEIDSRRLFDDHHNHDGAHLGVGEELGSDAHGRSLLEECSRTLLFAGAILSSLCATLLLFNLCKTHGCFNIFVTKLFAILAMSVIPEINTLPRTEYQALKLVWKLGLSNEAIYACPNNCMLFRGAQNASLRNCLVCQAPRFKHFGKFEVPRKMLWHFPLIPHL